MIPRYLLREISLNGGPKLAGEPVAAFVDNSLDIFFVGHYPTFHINGSIWGYDGV